MNNDIDFWHYLERLDIGRWYDLRSVYGRLLAVCAGFDMTFGEWVALLVVINRGYVVDIENLQIKRLKQE